MRDGDVCDVETCACVGVEGGCVLTTATPKLVLDVPKPKVQHTILRGNLRSLVSLVRGIRLQRAGTGAGRIQPLAI